jgi:putative membrane protein
MKAEDSARMRDLLASNRTLLGWIRTAISFAALGFVVARFGFLLAGQQNGAVSPHLIRFAGYIGTFMTLAGLLVTILGYLQHRSVLRQEQPPPGAPQPLRWVAGVTVALSAVSCAVLAVYLILSPSR